MLGNVLECKRNRDFGADGTFGSYNLMNPIWSFEVGVEVSWEWRDDKMEDTDTVLVADTYDASKRFHLVANAPGEYFGEYLIGKLSVLDEMGNSIERGAGDPVEKTIIAVRASEDKTSPNYNLYYTSESTGEAPTIYIASNTITADEIVTPDGPVSVFYTPLGVGTNIAEKVVAETHPSYIAQIESQNSGSKITSKSDSVKPTKFDFVNFPDLSANANKIQADATMPPLSFQVTPPSEPLAENAKYKWRVRTTYTSKLLSSSHKGKSSNGCKYPSTGTPSLWVLPPTGGRTAVCEGEKLKPLEKMDHWIVTDGPVLNISSDMKNESGSIYRMGQEYESIQLFGGGELEVLVSVDIKATSGEIKTLTRSWPPSDKNGIETKITGLNPVPSVIKSAANSSKPESLDSVVEPIFDEIIDEIACRESSRVMFNSGSGTTGIDITGFPLLAADGGYGMFQQTNPHPSLEEKWNWKTSMKDAIERVKRRLPTSIGIAKEYSSSADKTNVYYRDLSAQHNLSIGYFPSGSTTRRPIVCKDARLTTLLTGENELFDDQIITLKSPLNVFATGIRQSCPSGQGRSVAYTSSGGFAGVSKCVQIGTDVNGVSAAVVTASQQSAINTFADNLSGTDVEITCGSFGANGARRILGSKTGSIYSLDYVGICHKSPNCYVDVNACTSIGRKP